MGIMLAGNVLLKTHRIDRRGYIAKVSDFGASNACSLLSTLLVSTAAAAVQSQATAILAFPPSGYCSAHLNRSRQHVAQK